MHTVLELPFLAPVPVGHRVQIIRASRWQAPLFGGPPAWNPVPDPIIVDRDTGIVYAHRMTGANLVLEPLAFKPNVGHQIASLEEAKVTACLLLSESLDERPRLTTTLHVDIEPQGYRG